MRPNVNLASVCDILHSRVWLVSTVTCFTLVCNILKVEEKTFMCYGMKISKPEVATVVLMIVFSSSLTGYLSPATLMDSMQHGVGFTHSRKTAPQIQQDHGNKSG